MEENKEMRTLNMRRTSLIEQALFDPEELALLKLA